MAAGIPVSFVSEITGLSPSGLREFVEKINMPDMVGATSLFYDSLGQINIQLFFGNTERFVQPGTRLPSAWNCHNHRYTVVRTADISEFACRIQCQLF